MESGNRKIVWVSREDFKDLVLSRSKWCPLFGFIHYPDISPSSSISKCVDIIREARLVWNAFGIPNPYDSYPHPNNLPSLFEYPKDELLTARALFERAIDIMFNAQIKNPLRDYDRAGKPLYDFDQLSEDRIMYQVNLRGLTGYKGVRRDIESFKVFAILAIYEARWALRLMLENGKPDEDPEVLKSVQVATNLLNRAKEIKAEIDIKKREKEIEQMGDDAKRGAKVLQGAKKGGHAKRNSEDVKERYKAWQQEAVRIWKEKPEATKTYVVDAIIKRFKKEGKVDLLRGKELIRKVIKKPQNKKIGKMPA